MTKLARPKKFDTEGTNHYSLTLKRTAEVAGVDQATTAEKLIGKASPETKLAQGLVSAIAQNDIVAYAQCWTTIRHTKGMIKVIAPKITETEPSHQSHRDKQSKTWLK